MTTPQPQPPPTQAPILSTPESHIFEDPTPTSSSTSASAFTEIYRDNEGAFREVFEIERTVREVMRGGFRRVALQFPDGMLGVAGRVVGALEGGYSKTKTANTDPDQNQRIRFYILADTSYGSCCVDEIAAEHVSADVVIHYGRSCLSPTTRLPVIYIYTSQPLSLPTAVSSFTQTFPDREEKVLLMADITYQIHIPKLVEALRELGYTNLTAPEVVRDPGSVVPNRKVEEGVRERLGEYVLWHVAEPPKALLLTLAARVREMYIYPTTVSQTSSDSGDAPIPTPQSVQANTSLLLRRRYALLTTLSTAPILGILINTLSVSDHLTALSSLKKMISRAGKKSYTFVVGKVNAAKLANFSEIGGWVVVGCWESSLIEGSDFYKGVVTPFELGVALRGMGRGWDGSWRGDFGGLDDFGIGEESSGMGEGEGKEEGVSEEEGGNGREQTGGSGGDEDEDSESESEPPVYDLRTGRYISNSRPMRSTSTAAHQPSQSPNAITPQPSEASKSLTKRAKGDLATINGAVSPGAEFLRTQRTWTGLGSDFVQEEREVAGVVEEGRSGVARGYVVGDGEGGERR
ncbi:putative diphthamide synthesis protein-domain-containing protein [Leptodontidium sp. MPI-SDFR-AT-0119]|nr:putative diphthamide synthesis protein-domain-containing protein [Leptodontidium sp. MPI-SDFR-AT-0119]